MIKTIKLYETPDMKVFEMHTEGVMCASIVEDNYYGLRNISGGGVEDESEDWN